ncbi:MAG: lycopene cyclase family protein [Flammeovirgaceae bacterium]
MSSYYDIIIVGGGCAGLSLAYHIHLEPLLKEKKVLIIEPLSKKENDRTWCFWTKEATPYDSILTKSWKKLTFLGKNFSKKYDLEDFRYQMLRGEDFYYFVKNQLSKSKQFEYLQTKVELVNQNSGKVEVIIGKEVYTAKYVFDSRLDWEDIRNKTKKHTLLLQHFRGWLIETPNAPFEEDTIQMFDFRIPQKNEVRFMYVLPYSSRKALVEFTIFSKTLLSEEEYENELKEYICNSMKINNYEIKEKEKGVIPMTDFPFPKHEGNHLHFIGTKGGMCKPSTGYAFLRIQRDSQRIVKGLVREIPIEKLRPKTTRHHYLDAVMLDIMSKKGEMVNRLFEILFEKNGVELMLRFLDEQTTIKEDLTIMSSVPPLPFLRSILSLVKRSIFR